MRCQPFDAAKPFQQGNVAQGASRSTPFRGKPTVFYASTEYLVSFGAERKIPAFLESDVRPRE